MRLYFRGGGVTILENKSDDRWSEFVRYLKGENNVRDNESW